MIKIYHNSRCSKSRDGVCFLENAKSDFEIINYLQHPLSADDIWDILKKLGMKPIELVRKNEVIWKENFKNSNLSDTQIVCAMAEYPSLIERPIIVNGDKAVIGRPAENILKVF